MKALTAPFEQDHMEFIKNPIVAEFIGLEPNSGFTVSDWIYNFYIAFVL